VAYFISDNDRIVPYDHNLDPTTERFKMFQSGLVSGNLMIPFLKYFCTTPIISYSLPLRNVAEDMRKASNYSIKAAHCFGGVMLSIAF
jgi:hypothetical protein